MSIPSPTGDLRAWAIAAHARLFGVYDKSDKVEARPLAAAHMKGGERAVTDGVLMYDPVTDRLKVSINGVWRTITIDP